MPSEFQFLQIGICKRMHKEVASYKKEVTVNEARVQKMKDEGKDEYGITSFVFSLQWVFVTCCLLIFFTDIRKQEEVLQESYMMVPDSQTRLEKALGELSESWVRFFSHLSVKSSSLLIFL